AVHLLLAGAQDASTRRFLGESVAASLIKQRRLHVLSGYISNERVSDLLSASDAMWIGYIGFHTMSGVLVLAAMHGLPIIGSTEGIVGYLTTRQRIGMTVNPDSEASVIAALKQVAAGGDDMKAAAERAKTIFAGHTHTEFQRIIREAMD